MRASTSSAGKARPKTAIRPKPASRQQAAPTEKQVMSTLDKIIDPHTNLSLVAMGLISDVRVKKDQVSVTFRPTSPFCPLGVHLAQSIQRRLKDLDGVKRANVKVIGHVQEESINRLLDDSC